VNIGGDRAIYTALDSDASDEDYDPSDKSDVEDAADAFEISDEEVAGLLEEVNIDINDDDALLKTAKDRDIIKSWETSGWEEGMYCYFIFYGQVLTILVAQFLLLEQ
jgi:hypothetical protein